MAMAGWMVAACLAIPPGSDQIVARDLAAASPAFAAADPGTVIGWAPAPGVRRVFSVAELRRLARRLGILAVPEHEVCVERKVAPPDAGRMVAALQSQMPEGEVTLLDFSRAPVPEGELVFPRSGLRRAQGSLYWTGYVRYAPGRRFAIWAKVRVRAAQRVVLAATDLVPGRAIDAAQLRIETREGFPVSGFVETLDDAIGKWPRRSIRAGTAIAARWLRPAPEVIRGDPVKVEVWSGGAHLQLEARAETTGGQGERVAVRNPANQQRFFARVEGKGRVVVGPAAPVSSERGNP